MYGPAVAVRDLLGLLTSGEMSTTKPGHFPAIDEALARLHRAGWTIGDTASATEAGGLVCVASGHSGEELISAERRTAAEAWHMVVERA